MDNRTVQNSKYDFIVIGAGIAGLTLLYQLNQTFLRNRNILVIDPFLTNYPDSTISFWSVPNAFFNQISKTQYQEIEIRSPDFHKTSTLKKYQYYVIRKIDLFNKLFYDLEPQWHFCQDSVVEVANNRVITEQNSSYSAEWIFDSRFTPDLQEQISKHKSTIWQSFSEKIIKLEDANSRKMILMDWSNTTTKDPFTFYSFLPYQNQASFYEVQLSNGKSLYQDNLTQYIEQTIGAQEYQLVSKSSGTLPLTTFSFPRKSSTHTLTIGAAAGLIKPSTGYGFSRIWHDSFAIANSLVKHNHPFNIPGCNPFFSYCDYLMLRLMKSNPQQIAPVFSSLFDNVETELLLKFLNEETTPKETLQVILQSPRWAFLRAALHI